MKVKWQSFRPHETKAASGRRRESRVRTSQGIVRERGAAVAGRVGGLAGPARGRGRGEGESAPLARGVLRHMGVVFTAAAVFATAFTAWTPASLSPGEFVEQLLEAASCRAGAGAP